MKKTSRSTISLLWYLNQLSSKHNIEFRKLYDALLVASKMEESTCGSLKIEFRGVDEDSQIFLITDGSQEYIAQLSIPQILLNQQNISRILQSKNNHIFSINKTGVFRRLLKDYL